MSEEDYATFLSLSVEDQAVWTVYLCPNDGLYYYLHPHLVTVRPSEKKEAASEMFSDPMEAIDTDSDEVTTDDDETHVEHVSRKRNQPKSSYIPVADIVITDDREIVLVSQHHDYCYRTQVFEDWSTTGALDINDKSIVGSASLVVKGGAPYGSSP